MVDIKPIFRCSSLGRIMTSPRSKGELLSEGAKTHIRELLAQHVYETGPFTFWSKETQKGIEVESDSIGLLNRVRGLSLTKNSERITRDGLSGSCDLFDAGRNAGHDIKSSWWAKTFPTTVDAAIDKDYEWQMRGYMALWGADSWEVNYCLVDTPAHLLHPNDPIDPHIVSHIPEKFRLTTWVVKRDEELEKSIFAKIKVAQQFFSDELADFYRTHQ